MSDRQIAATIVTGGSRAGFTNTAREVSFADETCASQSADGCGYAAPISAFRCRVGQIRPPCLRENSSPSPIDRRRHHFPAVPRRSNSVPDGRARAKQYRPRRPRPRCDYRDSLEWTALLLEAGEQPGTQLGLNSCSPTVAPVGRKSQAGLPWGRELGVIEACVLAVGSVPWIATPEVS